METPTKHLSTSSPPRRILWVAGVCALYFAAARLGLLLAFEGTNASPVWPPSGIGLAAALALGYGACVGIFVGAFLANLVTFAASQTADPYSLVAVCACIGLGNALEAGAGAYLLRRFTGSRDLLGRIEDLIAFAAIALLICVASAAMGPTSLALAGIVPWSLYEKVWFTWWMGDVAGVLILTPMLLAWWRQPRQQTSRRHQLETAALFLVLFAFGRLIFSDWLPESIIHSEVYLLFLVLLPGVFRLGPRAITTAVVLVSGLAIWGTINGHGAFVRASLNDSLLSLQAFTCTTAISMMALVATLNERRRTRDRQAALHHVREEVWKMDRSTDIENVLVAVRNTLAVLGVPFRECGINLVDTTHEPPVIHVHNMSRAGSWRSYAFSPEEAEQNLVLRIWRSGELTYRRDLERDDPHDEWETLRRGFGFSVRSVLDIPFPHGTLAINSAEPHAFASQHISLLQDLAEVLSEGLQRRQDLDRLARSEARYRSLVETPDLAVMLLDAGGHCLYASPQIEKFTGYSPESFYIDPTLADRIIHPQDPQVPGLREARTSHESKSEFRWQAPSGAWRWIARSVYPLYDSTGAIDAVQFVFQDITASRLAAEQVQSALQAKEVLLKEMHHRVKNNLQVIISLLNLQSRYVRDPQVLEILLENQHRVQSISLIHEKLYQSSDLEHIDFSEYIPSLVRDLYAAYSISTNHIALDIRVEDIALDAQAAIPCGLILNELVSNALKHAFPDDRRGRLSIALERGAEARVHLRVSDNGVGLPPELVFNNSSSLGLKLVHTLVGQLKGQLEVRREGGSHIDISFRL